ncbi:ATP-binding protein [Nakamurella sp. GG22]
MATDGARVNGVFDGASAELGGLLRSVDWASTPLGPVESWSPVLRMLVPTVLRSGFPTIINWGADFVAVYNDAYVPVMGGKHPSAVGKGTRDTWPEAWEWVRPRLERVFRDGATVTFQDEQQILHRHGYPEECYFTFSQSPIIDVDGSIGGILTVATETTARVLSERRLRVARELGEVSGGAAAGVTGTCRAALRVLQGARASLPFALAYLTGSQAEFGAGELGLEVVASYGLTTEPTESDPSTRAGSGALGWVKDAAARVTRTGEAEVLQGLRELAGKTLTPGPLGPLLPDTAVVMPLILTGRSVPVGALILGISPYRPLNQEYQSFIDLVGRQLRVALTDADAHESEQRRLQLLADLDHAKTVFYQNVSHELRTPLTLLLAPLQDLLSSTGENPTVRADLEAAVRAAERLRGLVDALLDASGAQPGALIADRRPIDVGTVTAEAASMFRSTAEHAGLAFAVEVPEHPVTAAADRSMWFTIVTNLVSNAVKYTPAGGVRVRLATVGADAVLTVTDTGTGISADHQAKVFDRFYRAAPEEPATGTGIGLSLVADLVRAHHGRVDLVSTPGGGTTISVTIPLGTPPVVGEKTLDDRVTGRPVGTGAAPAVLIVEDDEDLRAYLRRLLTDDGWAVTAVADAEAALPVAYSTSNPPDLVLTDVMLPGRSGLHLVSQLRSNPVTERLPILVLTARGGPDAAADGLAAGADDYISKPFSSRELLARVRANHELHRLRETAVSTAEHRAEQIKGALETNRMIGTATGMVMATYQLTAQQAFRLLTLASQNTNTKLRDLAATVTTTGALPYRRTTIDDLLIRTATAPSQTK